ncbi:MAG: ATP-binding protein [Nitrososphaerales archaeon]|jgi:SpoVK/Ycf46/Vps4 family AAA+-type ATPase
MKSSDLYSSHGPLEIPSSDIREQVSNCRGEYFLSTYAKVKNVITHQLGNTKLDGIKGFVFYGEAGNGKTLMARVLAKELSLPLFFVDGSVIARELYGQSERQIVKVFALAQKKKSLILIDDAESVFPDRDWMKGESWHVAQNNILFHQIDTLDTSKTCLIMTTNKYQLLDSALKDRLYPIQFPQLDVETAVSVAKMKCEEKGVDSNQVIKRINSNPENFRSGRAIEKLIVEEYISQFGSQESAKKSR